MAGVAARVCIRGIVMEGRALDPSPVAILGQAYWPVGTKAVGQACHDTQQDTGTMQLESEYCLQWSVR